MRGGCKERCPLNPFAIELIFSFILLSRVNAGVSPLRRRPKGFPIALWKPSGCTLPYLTFCVKFLVCVLFVFPCNDKNQVTWEATAKGSRGRPQTFVCFHCPLVASADAKPSAQHRIACRNNNIAHYANSPLTQASCARGLLLFTDAQPRYTASWSPFRPAPDRPSSSR